MSISAPYRFTPTVDETAMARESGASLSNLIKDGRPLRVTDGQGDHFAELPPAAARMLGEILGAMAEGRSVRVLPEETELTTAQAADVLNISRPFLIRLLDDGVMPHRKVGTHRRLRADDVLAYKSRRAQEREAVLDQLAAEAQSYDMGYDAA
jgi:excisionase family DNA binding protein